MKTVIQYPGLAPEARPMGPAPLSPALRIGDQLFVSGQVGMDPMTGRIVGSDVATQARQALANLRALVEAAGFAMSDVVKVTVFLTDLTQFPALNAAYREAFAEPYPVRSTVGVTLAPAELLVEIEAVAVRGAGA